jgi:hypothetical protein
VTKPTPNITRLDPGRPEIAILVDAMLRAREVVASRSWSTSQEPTTEHWWADVLADPRARYGGNRAASTVVLVGERLKNPGSQTSQVR